MPQKLTVLDLFSGIGGFSLGLERTGGFRTIAFCEIEPYCQRVLRKHWPDVPIHSDIRSLTAGQFERKPDVIVGGFPCQDISVAGKQAGISGERSGLWFEMLRVIRELRPTWLLIENVPNLRTKGADIVFAGLEEANYTWTSAVVGAWAVGAPHKRDRVWIMAHSEGERLSERHAELQGGTRQAESYRKSTPILADSISVRQPRPWVPIDTSYQETHREGQAGDVVDVCIGSKWATEPNMGRVANGVPDRVHRLRALGNSVVPQIPELFGQFILQVEQSQVPLG